MVSEIDGGTRFCAVFGHPIRHSASPAMHNAALAALGLPWRYLAFDVDPAHLRAAIDGARRMNFAGLNLTVPHKLLALEMVDEVEDRARFFGAINTVRFEGRDSKGDWVPLGLLPEAAPAEVRSRGYNTDADAVIRALREDLSFEPKGHSVLLLGAGGAGRVAALRLAEEGVRELWLVNRTEAKATEVMREIEARFPSVNARVGYPVNSVDLAMNATSLGLKEGDGLPFDPQQFNFARASAAYDMIYRPAETPFLAAA